MGRIRRFAALVPLSLLVLTSSPALVDVRAQDGSPVASPASAECAAPGLAPGTPTPPELLATPVATDEDAFPALDEGTAADEATAANAIAAMETVIGCVAAGDFTNIGALMTDNFVRNFLELPSAYDVGASLEGAGPFVVHRLDDVRVHDDGRVSVRFIYGGFFSGPDSYTAERWVLADDGGTLKIDQISPTTFPDDLLPGAVIVEVTMVDYAYLVEPSVLPSGTPIILRATAVDSAAEEGHEIVLMQLPEGTTAQQLIQGEMSDEQIEAEGTFYGFAYAEPGQTADIAVASLEPGTYFLVCYVSAPDGTPHVHLGMATEITVE